jgi:putative flippase GtrA
MDTALNLKQASKKDFFLSAFIGAAFGLFSIPILNNIRLPFLKLGVTTYLTIIVFFVFFAILAIWIAALMGRKVPVIFQFAKFAAVGAFNSFFDWGILNLLIALTGIASGAGYSLFKGTSFIFATISSFFWNKYWTFEDRAEVNTKETGSFIMVSVIGLIINISLASLIVYFLSSSGIEPKRLANIGAASATIASLIWNFIGYKFIVFKK